MIKSFSCHNFRNIDIEHIELEKLNILIGPNNSGKTNFIKALTFYSNMLKYSTAGTQESAFLNAIARNGWEKQLSKAATVNEAIYMSWELDYEKQESVYPALYEFEYAVGTDVRDCHIIRETFSAVEHQGYENPFNYFEIYRGRGKISTAQQKGESNQRLYFDVSNSEVFLMQFKDLLIANETMYENEWIRKNIANLLQQIDTSFRSIYSYSSSQINTDAVRGYSSLKEISGILRKDASNFLDVFQACKNDSLIWKQRFIDRLKMLMFDLSEIEIIGGGDKWTIRLVYKEDEFVLSDMSEGTIKAMVLCLLFESEKKYDLLAYDEPENNLHPAWLKNVGYWVENGKSYNQCVISTHSPDFLDSFTERFRDSKDIALLVFDGAGNIKRVEYKDIKEDMGEWQLGDLYRVNDPALGGWPW